MEARGGGESESEAEEETVARNWKHALFLAVVSVERNAPSRFKEAGAMLREEDVFTADQAQFLVEDIRKFIRKGFPREQRDFLRKRPADLTSSELVRRNAVLGKERTYYKRFFKIAYAVDDWGVTGKRRPRPPPPDTPPPSSPLPNAPQPPTPPVETWIYVLKNSLKICITLEAPPTKMCASCHISPKGAPWAQPGLHSTNQLFL
jgi:hypothetical protein